MPRVAGNTAMFTKTVVYGPSGSGKTLFGLTGLHISGEMWPDPLFVNTEHGVDAYESVFPGKFQIEDVSTIEEAMDVAKKVKAGAIKCGTLVIDTWTVLRDTYSSGQRRVAEGKGKDPGVKEFSKVNAKMDDLQNALVGLPCHVIIVAQETDLYDPKSAPNLVKIGVKIDANKHLDRWADFILHFQPRKDGQTTMAKVIKSRGVKLGDKDMMIKNPSWAGTFKAIAEQWASGEFRPVESETEAIERTVAGIEAEEEAIAEAQKSGKPVHQQKTEVSTPNFQNTKFVAGWLKYWAGKGVDEEDIKAIFDINDVHSILFTPTVANDLITNAVKNREEANA